MIENYLIDKSRGYPNRGHPDEYQVGLYIRADEQMARKFRHLLWRNGLHSVPIDRLPPNKPEFTHFTYVSAPDRNLDKDGIYEQLEPLCEQSSVSDSRRSKDELNYDTWRAKFDDYIRQYQSQRYASKTEGHEKKPFRKDRAYALIQSDQYEDAERYLNAFTTDAPPFLVPAYLVYLYHTWGKHGKVIETHRRYAAQINASDVDHRVIEWIVKSYLSTSPPRLEQALAVLDDFLPEFQRQRVAESLLTLRAQARTMQGQLPETLPDLRNYINRLPEADLNRRLEDLLEVVSGLSAPNPDIYVLLDEMAARLQASSQWRIELERSTLARRSGNQRKALGHIQSVIDEAPSDLSAVDLGALRLSAADLHLALEEPEVAADVLQSVAPEALSPDEQRAYWSLRGRALVLTGNDDALDSLRRAYQAGSRRPEVLRSLGRLAYREGDSQLAWQVYTDLLHTGFEPSREDRLYAGILAYCEDDDPVQAIHQLQPALEVVPIDALPAETLLMAYETLTSCLQEIQAPHAEIANALASQIDLLVAEGDVDGLIDLVEHIPEMGLGRPTTFGLLEAIEPILYDHPEGLARLVNADVNLFWQEVDIALRQAKALPSYTRDLRRALFALDREQFDVAQTYLEEELQEARDKGLVEPDFEPEPSESEPLDLSGQWVALVGGYAPMRRRVKEILTREHNLERFTEVPPSWEEYVDQKRVAEAVRGADLIVVVHRCIKHDGTDALKSVAKGTILGDRIRYVDGKGQSAAIRVVLEYFDNWHDTT